MASPESSGGNGMNNVLCGPTPGWELKNTGDSAVGHFESSRLQDFKQNLLCRYTGPSLAEFLQALLDIAAQKLKFKEKGSSGELEQPQEGSLHNRRDLRGTSSDPYEEEAEEAPVPDLLFIGLDLDDPVQITSDPETQPRDYDPIRWNMTHYHNRLLMVRQRCRPMLLWPCRPSPLGSLVICFMRIRADSVRCLANLMSRRRSGTCACS